MNNTSERGDPAELAALYSAGALPDDEGHAFDERLAGGCPLSNAEVASLSPTIESLADLAEAVEPPRRVFDAIQARINSADRTASPSGPQVWRNWDSTSKSTDLVVVRKDEGAWDETGVAGVRIRRLLVDRERNQFTGLVKMEAGYAWPKHVHNGPEECLVLEGDLQVGDELELKAGDYQYAPPGSLHSIESTRGGCLLLITSSLSDEMV